MYEAKQNKEKVSRSIEKRHTIHRLKGENNRQTLQKLRENENIRKSVIQMTLEGKWFNSLSDGEKNALKSLETHSNSNILSKEQIHAFSAYTGGSFEHINNYLRTLFKNDDIKSLKRYKVSAGEQNKKNDEKYIFNMNKAFSKALPIPDQIIVYRGCGGVLMDEKGDNILFSKEEIVGKIIIEPAFLSTSANRKHAEKFAKKVLLVITVPQGIPAFYVTKKLENRTMSGKLRDEDEIIFQPGMKMRIDKKQNGRNGILELYTTMLSESTRIDTKYNDANMTNCRWRPKLKTLSDSMKSNSKIIIPEINHSRALRVLKVANRSNKRRLLGLPKF